MAATKKTQQLSRSRLGILSARRAQGQGASDPTTQNEELAHGLDGLSRAEVYRRRSEGKSNAHAEIKTKSVRRIVWEHTATLFNAVNLVMALLVLSTGQLRHMLFMIIVVANLLIGIVQELRAKHMVDKLTLLTAKKVRVRRGGRTRRVSLGHLVLDDLMILARGEQVPADATVIAGEATMNESLLTGESEPISKRPGDEILSGSFVDSGSIVCRITAVGDDCYVAKITREAKRFKTVHSEIMDTIRTIIRVASIAIVPIGLGLFLSTIDDPGATIDNAILQTVSAVVGMIPQGLVLLVSSVLAIATTRLGRRKVLVQQAYCIETLARVDVLCLDKTGTITTGAMEVADVHAADSDPREPMGVGRTMEAISTIAEASAREANATSRAILEFCRRTGVRPLASVRTVAFSSARKYSGVVCADGRAFVMGAGQFVLGDAYEDYRAQIEDFDALERVMVVARVDGFDEDGALLGLAQPLGFVGIRDQIRRSAAQTMSYFTEQGVDLRVISGDDPRTAAAIAASVGIAGATQAVDASHLESDEEIAAAVRDCRIFGRVTPQMKRRLVQELKAQGHTVAMTGDGVNDVLAFKEADCSVAMAAGSAAARNVAEIVLADNDFSHMPEVVAEGRRSINNLQRSASLFLMKTVYTALLAIICIFAPPFPFKPAQMSLISGAIIGLPSFALALEPNHERIKGRFLVNVLSRSMPASIAIVIALSVTIGVERSMGLSFEEISTTCLLVIAALGLLLIWRISQPMTPLRWALLFCSAALVVGGMTVLRWYFEVVTIPVPGAVVALVASVCCAILFNKLYTYATVWADGRSSDEQAAGGHKERTDDGSNA